jgi:hypothetical protein
MEIVKMICTDKTWDDLHLEGGLRFEGIQFERVIEELDSKAYLTAKDELEAEHMLDTKLAQLYAENNFLVGQWKFLSQQVEVLTAALKKKPHDLPITVQLQKMQKDIEIIGPASRFVNAAIFKHLEKKYGEGKKFVYCKTEA